MYKIFTINSYLSYEFFVMLFSELGPDPREITSLGVNIIKLDDERLGLVPILNDDYVYNNTNNPIVGIPNGISIPNYNKYRLSESERLLVNAMFMKGGDLRRFMRDYYHDGKYYPFPESLCIDGELAHKYSYLARIHYHAKHDLYHIIDSDGAAPAFSTDSDIVFNASNKLGLQDSTKRVFCGYISSLEAVRAEFTTLFGEISTFNVSKLIQFSKAIDECIVSSEDQYVCMMSDYRYIKSTIANSKNYLLHQRSVTDFLSEHREIQYNLIEGVVNFIDQNHPNSLYDVFQYLHQEYQYSEEYCNGVCNVATMISLLYQLSFSMSRYGNSQLRKLVYNQSADLGLRFTFLHNKQAIDLFVKLLTMLEQLTLQSSHSVG